jgi:hypothetical protein
MASYEKIASLAAAGGFKMPDKAAAMKDKINRTEKTFGSDVTGTEVLARYMADNHAELITETLRPAFDRLITEVRQTCPANTPTTAVEAVRGAQHEQNAYFRLVDNYVPRYVAILQAAQAIYESTPGPRRDRFRIFEDTTRPQSFRPGTYKSVGVPETISGPTEPAARLLYLAHDPDAEPFLNSPAERDELA